MNERFSDEMLMRFADGELDAEEMELVEKAMEADDELVSRVAMFIETKAHAQAALKPLLDEPVPEALQASVAAMVAAKKAKDAEAGAGATVLPFEPRQKNAPPAPRRWTLPLAASIAAVAGGLAGYWAAGGSGPTDRGVSVAGYVDADLGEALASVPASQEIALADGTRFRAIASFRNDLAELCREFELDTADRSTSVSVACHSDGAWKVSFMVAATGGTDGYAPASSTEALDAYLSAIEAGEPLSPKDEAAALIAARGD
jgi:anti-sigma factor RsiW